MNVKKCKLLRKIARLTSKEVSKETLYFKHETMGSIHVGKCERANYLAMKKFERNRKVTRSYLKEVISSILNSQAQNV